MRLFFKTSLSSFLLAFCALCGILFSPNLTQDAIANGDTRTLYLHHSHTGEEIAATYLKNGSYDPKILAQLNHFLRDWRNDDVTQMDPRLFDVMWETYRESGSRNAIQVVSAYRSPETNAMLRRRSQGVAEHSQHILGKAMDVHYTDVPMEKIREIGLRLQRGGVGYYPTAGTPFVHLDVGNVRYWPRMEYTQLARLFPDGKAPFIAADGRTLPHYEEAQQELAQNRRGSSSMPVQEAKNQPTKGFFASLFGNQEEAEDASLAYPSADPLLRTPQSQKVASFENVSKPEGRSIPLPPTPYPVDRGFVAASLMHASLIPIPVPVARSGETLPKVNMSVQASVPLPPAREKMMAMATPPIRATLKPPQVAAVPLPPSKSSLHHPADASAFIPIGNRKPISYPHTHQDREAAALAFATPIAPPGVFAKNPPTIVR